MHLHAVSIGEAVPRQNFDAEIQSVFDSAVNLRLAREDRLLTVLLSESYELPQGIRVASRDAHLRSLAVSQRAAARGGILRFESSLLSIDLRGAAVWKCPVGELNLDPGTRRVRESCSRAWGLLNKWQRLRQADLVADDLFQSKSGSVLSQRMREPVMELIAATDGLDVKGSIQSAQNIIGLGPGVTPSGDDLLIGFLAGLWSLAGRSQPLLSFLQSFGSALMPITTRTNEISRTYLYHATRGQFSSSLSNLLEAIAGGHDVEPATQTAIRVGHSSGMDSVTGLLLGLRVWNQTHSFANR
jgi:hypothetical protein